MYWVGVDVGGTFTDVVLCDSGVSRLTKTPSTPADQSEGIVRGVSALGIEPQGIVRFGHGSTVATNTAQERNGARIAVLVTRGHRDVGLVPSVVGDMIDAVRTLHGRGLTSARRTERGRRRPTGRPCAPSAGRSDRALGAGSRAARQRGRAEMLPGLRR
jgi:N-methylhydantoinase A/oxoprolinase/acetone carboxylase beta subunit